MHTMSAIGVGGSKYDVHVSYMHPIKSYQISAGMKKNSYHIFEKVEEAHTC